MFEEFGRIEFILKRNYSQKIGIEMNIGRIGKRKKNYLKKFIENS